MPIWLISIFNAICWRCAKANVKKTLGKIARNKYRNKYKYKYKHTHTYAHTYK